MKVRGQKSTILKNICRYILKFFYMVDFNATGRSFENRMQIWTAVAIFFYYTQLMVKDTKPVSYSIARHW